MQNTRMMTTISSSSSSNPSESNHVLMNTPNSKTTITMENPNLHDTKCCPSMPSTSDHSNSNATTVDSFLHPSSHTLSSNTTTTTNIIEMSTNTPSTSSELSSWTNSSHNNHYSINFFNLPLKNSSIPKVWHTPLQWQASIILFTVYTGYLLQTIYTFKKQEDKESTFWVFITGVLTILVNSGRLIRMEKAENTLESKVIILFNILSFSIRFYVLKTNRGILLSNALATIAVMSKNTAHSKAEGPFWATFPVAAISLHYVLLALYEIVTIETNHLDMILDILFEHVPSVFTVIIFGTFIIFGNVQLSSECDQLQETTEKLKTALDAKTKFVSHLSHEFRTPTLSSLGSIELIKETNLTKEQRELIDTIESAESILLTLIEDILLFVKTEHESKNEDNHTSTDITTYTQVFNLEKCIESVREIISSYASKFHVDVKTVINVKDPSSLMVKMNQARMSQILVNLLTNAVKASHGNSSVELHCNIIPCPLNINRSSNHQTLEKTWFEFKVVDYGVGIPKDKQQYIFQPFGQLHNLNESIFPGSGLGLSTIKNIVKSMGGQIELFSKENEGSTFIVKIPIQICEHSSLQHYSTLHEEDMTIKKIDIQSNYLDQFQRAQNYTRTTEFTQQDTILTESYIILAEDNAINRKVISKMMQSLGFNVDVVSDGKELIEKINPQRHKLVITDMHMPNLNGLEAAMLIKQKYKDIKIIMLTADALTNEAQYAAVVDAVICKPCKRSDLKHNIESLLNKVIK